MNKNGMIVSICIVVFFSVASGFAHPRVVGEDDLLRMVETTESALDSRDHTQQEIQEGFYYLSRGNEWLRDSTSEPFASIVPSEERIFAKSGPHHERRKKWELYRLINSIETYLDQYDPSGNSMAAAGIYFELAMEVLGPVGERPSLAFAEGDVYDFRVVLTGHRVEHVFTINNRSAEDIILEPYEVLSSPFALLGSGNHLSSSHTDDNCDGVIKAKTSCPLIVEYSPIATARNSEMLTVSYRTRFGHGAVSIELQGSGYYPLMTVDLLSPIASPGRDSTPTLKIGQLIPDLEVHLYNWAGCFGSLMNSAVTSGTTVELTSGQLRYGPHEFHVVVNDSYGHASPCSASNAFYMLE